MKKAMLILSLLATLPLAYAQKMSEDGFYGVVAAGPTSFTTSSNSGSTGNGYKIGAGYDYNKYLAFEFAYYGVFKQTEKELGVEYFSNDRTAYSLGAIGKFPINDSFRLIGGYSTMSMKQTLALDLNLSGNKTTTERNFSHGVVSLGAEVNLDARTSVRYEYSKLNSVPISGTTVTTEGTMTQIGLVYKF
jgi:hypothetical protein